MRRRLRSGLDPVALAPLFPAVANADAQQAQAKQAQLTRLGYGYGSRHGHASVARIICEVDEEVSNLSYRNPRVRSKRQSNGTAHDQRSRGAGGARHVARDTAAVNEAVVIPQACVGDDKREIKPRERGLCNILQNHAEIETGYIGGTRARGRGCSLTPIVSSAHKTHVVRGVDVVDGAWGVWIERRERCTVGMGGRERYRRRIHNAHANCHCAWGDNQKGKGRECQE